MKKISFVVNTANNEKRYLFGLIDSIIENTEFKNHELLVFIDSDNENTYEDLCKIYKSKYNNILVYKNKNSFPTSYQRNISILFEKANNDLVCYLQSDMVVCPKFDYYLLNEMGDDTNKIVCCGRVEPPLHPADNDKIHNNLGLTPEEFNKTKFYEFCKAIQANNRPSVNGFFAPFCTYKSVFLDTLGGFDPQFRNSREDSDFIIKLYSNKNLQTIISWKAIVYHYTCVSSRGVKWYDGSDTVAKHKKELQEYADMEELKKFIRKWGYFGHHYKPRTMKALQLIIDKPLNLNHLEILEPYFDFVVVDDDMIKEYFRGSIAFKSYYYNNKRLNFTLSDWKKNCQYYNSYTNPLEKCYRTIESIQYSVNILRVKTSAIETLLSNMSIITELDDAILNEPETDGEYTLTDGVDLFIHSLQDINKFNLKLDYAPFISDEFYIFE